MASSARSAGNGVLKSYIIAFLTLVLHQLRCVVVLKATYKFKDTVLNCVQPVSDSCFLPIDVDYIDYAKASITVA